MNNRKIIISTLLAFLFITYINAYTEKNLLQQAATLEQVKSALIMDQKWVSYPGYTDRGGWDKLLGDNKTLLIERGEKALSYTWEVVKATDYLEYERSGNRDIMESPFGRNNNAIVNLFLAELAEGKGRFIDQLINGVFYSCEMTSWVLSAHLGGQGAQTSRRSLPDYKEHVIDLTSGDLGSMLSWVYYFFHAEFDKVNPAISERLRHELQVRILDTYMEIDRFWWMAFDLKPGGMVNNWNPWCNSNVLQSFFLLENDRDKLAKAVYRTMVSVDKFLNYTHLDGGCEEGPSYWGHAAGKMYDYLQMLSDGTGGKVSLFSNDMIRKMGEYIVRSYVGNGWVVNFADASARGGGGAPIIYRYGKAVKSDMMIQHAAYMNHLKKDNLSFGRDIFRALQTLLYDKEFNSIEGKPQSPAYSWYPETEFCYMTNKNGFFVATKGGYNNESHNHNDLGTFSLYLNTTPIFIDAGVGTYTRQTFSSERYTIWTMQSNYHNLPMINGVPQKFGSNYKATDVTFNPKSMYFSANIAQAYPEEANVRKWTRSYTLKNNELRVEDNFVLDKIIAPNQINFLTWGDVDVSVAGEIKVNVKGEKAVLKYDKNVFDVEKETIKQDDSRLSNVWGSEVYRISLNAKKEIQSGKYNYTIKQLKD
ncbi:heparinase II/III-family protein [Massilibacteroides sp.]|uniref:heparinase II/III family protein n=1 Tax=Massilibacteroides sp. TaxID=2034766 RepID=UPI00263257BF|nr:heparinase II/III-family protein [Massilibacteroides sp.]MDD4515910.1 heparinase II/III-family protein [Massilibacteroides sp.]